MKGSKQVQEHLQPRQLKGYQDRTLAMGELLAVDAHLGGCPECRAALAAPADAILSGIDQARFHHLSYEQMDDWVEDRLDAGARELVTAHIDVCPACARQLRAYQEYAPAMAAPAEITRPWWAFLKQPQYALGAAALAAFFIIVPMSRHSSPEPTGAIVAPSTPLPENRNPRLTGAFTTAELDDLPDSVRRGVKELINAPESSVRPDALTGLESTDATLEYPLSEVVEETQPAMRWKTFGQFYTVSLYDSRQNLVSRRGGLNETTWTPSSSLTRGELYTWEVESGNQRYRGTFRVLGDKELADLNAARTTHGGSHLVMGAVSEELGMLTTARREFQAMAKDPSQADQAAKMLRHLDALRK